MPLDLHVLGLPLAFILSQDQTLHCIKCFVKSLAQISKVLFEITLFQEWKTLAAQSLQRTLFVYRYMNISLFLRGSDRFSQPSFAPGLTAVFSAESGAKINTFFETSKSFFKISFRFENFQNPLTRISAIADLLAGCKSKNLFRIFQIFSKDLLVKTSQNLVTSVEIPRLQPPSLSKRVQR